MKHYYFAYGSNTNLKQMAERCPNAVCLGNAYIDGYAFRWRDYADIEISEDDYVIGVLWEINDFHLSCLDYYEGFPRLYTRQKVVINHLNEKLLGWTYLMVNQNVEIQPNSKYMESVYDGYKQNDLSEDQLDKGLDRLF